MQGTTLAELIPSSTPGVSAESEWAERDTREREREEALKPKIMTRSFGVVTIEELLEKLAERAHISSVVTTMGATDATESAREVRVEAVPRAEHGLPALDCVG
jgi:hypothetical protein